MAEILVSDFCEYRPPLLIGGLFATATKTPSLVAWLTRRAHFHATPVVSFIAFSLFFIVFSIASHCSRGFGGSQVMSSSYIVFRLDLAL
jgi:hypothetical protein